MAKRMFSKKISPMAWLWAALCLWLGLAQAAQAQQLSARQIMDRAVEAFQQAGGIQVDFTYRIGTASAAQKGSIQLQGSRFVLTAGGITTWFDGRTQWSYVPQNEEVNVTEPTAEDLQGLHPYAWLGLYREGGQLTLDATTAKAYRLTLIPAPRPGSVRQLVLTLDKRTYYPQTVKLQFGLGDHDYTEIHLQKLTPRQHYVDGHFRFDEKKYPQVEVIDLR